MPAPRIFTEAELNLARTWRRYNESWRAIGRRIGCEPETIRSAIEPDYRTDRTREIVDRRRKRRAA